MLKTGTPLVPEMAPKAALSSQPDEVEKYSYREGLVKFQTAVHEVCRGNMSFSHKFVGVHSHIDRFTLEIPQILILNPFKCIWRCWTNNLIRWRPHLTTYRV